MKNTAYNLAVTKYINDNYGGDADNLFGSRKRKKAQAKAGGFNSIKEMKKAAKLAKARENETRKAKEKLQNSLELVAQRDEKPIEEVSLQYLEQPQNKEKMATYVREKGEAPLQNTAELATQAYMLRSQDVSDLGEQLDLPEDDAEAVLEDAETEIAESYTGASDALLGALLAPLLNVAKKGLRKIAEQKASRGKHGLFAKIIGAADKAANGATQKEVDTANAADAAQAKQDNANSIADIAKQMFDSVKSDEKKKEITKMLPYIIGGVVVLVLLTVLITKHASRK